MGNKIAEKIAKPKRMSDRNWKNVKEVVVPPEKR